MTNPIFITGRFCSGTTFLWNFFHWMPDYRAYYEPLNPGLLSSVKYITPNPKHKGVNDYWQEYRKLSDLQSYYSPDFGFERLALETNESHENLKNYITYLTQKNYQKKLAIKFNRIDFRLGWIAKNFPEAKIIYIKRNIRDAWLSTRAHLPIEAAKDMFQFNAYELAQWVIALDDYFPFIIDASHSSYHLHYFLAKLSEKFSEHYANCVIDFDQDIVNNFDVFVKKISTITSISQHKIREFSYKKVVPTAKEYTPEEISWMNQVEKECNDVLHHLHIAEMSPEELLQKKFKLQYPEKRKIFIQQLLVYSYQLENQKISLRGQLDIEWRKSIYSRIGEKIKQKLIGK